MTDTRIPPAAPAEPGAALLRAGRFFRSGPPAPEARGHDRLVDGAYGVHRTGSHSPARLRHPYVRGVLLQMYREAKQRLGDPVLAWADVQGDPERRRRYQRARGKGGLLRASWDEAIELVAAAQVHTIRTYGPDRIAGFSPAPASSMVSHAAGARFHSLIGAPMLSGHDGYAGLPVASPQVFGDRADGPEPGDLWDAAYLMVCGSNAPVARTADAHRMAEARYRGQKVVVVAPDHADSGRFADEWLHPHPGTDGALALAMGHVILKEFFVDRGTPFFTDYVRRFTDLPFLVTLEERDGSYVPAKFLRASDLGQGGEGAEWKTVVLDEATGRAVVPNGSLGFRWTKSGQGRWNLELGGTRPRLSLHGAGFAVGVEVLLPRFDTEGGAAGPGRGDVVRRGVPATKLGGVNGPLVTTVFDLLLARYGVARPGLPGRWPESYDDAGAPGTPAWQEAHTSVPAATCIRIAREFARTAERSEGRCMILMDAGTHRWFHSETIHRAFLALLQLTGCPGRDGGGWARYGSQEECLPLTGWATLADASDWSRPSRRMIGAAYWFLSTGRWRHDRFTADVPVSPLGAGRLRGMTGADCLALSARSGWMPSYPTFDRNPLELGEVFGDPVARVVAELRAGTLRFACEDPDAPENWPRVLTLWRADLPGSSAKDGGYVLRHLLGTHASPGGEEAPEGVRPRDVTWREEEPEGKLDLLLSLDVRQTPSTLLSDVVLPVATRYEKHDLSSADAHVHACTPALDPPWQARTEFDTFKALAERLSALAVGHLGVRKDLVATPLQHDTPGETAQPGGVVLDWKRGECDPVPGRTLPNLTVVERDYTAVGARFAALGPLVEQQGLPVRGITLSPDEEVGYLRQCNGVSDDDRPLLDTPVKAANAVLALSGTTNGRLAAQGFATLEGRTGQDLAHLAAEHAGRRLTYADAQAAPLPVLTSPEWSGGGSGERRRTAFTRNTEHLEPWHTLTGRQHFFLDHDWIHEIGEALPVYRPPLDARHLFGEPPPGPDGQREVPVRFLTPHDMRSLHSAYQDDLFVLALSHGGQRIWMSPRDAEVIGAADDDWVETVDRDGVRVARAAVSHRIPPGSVYLRHAREGTGAVPTPETTGRRGGLPDPLTRLMLKPSHLVGGYAQLCWAFTYLGPTGSRRDEMTVIRRRSEEVES